jgi:RNA-binding protein
MISTKERATLRGFSNNIPDLVYVGKEGVTENFLDQLDEMLTAREIVKVTILETAGLEAKETANAICEALRAEFVQAIGFKFTIYRKNLEEPKIVFPGHEQAKAKKVDNTVTKKGKATKRSRR